MNQKLITLLFVVLVPFLVKASIFCPPDKSMLCSDDKYNLDIMGKPVLMGNSYGHKARYIDDNQLNSCNVGFIYRKWYVDTNNDNIWQDIELYCIQTLHFSYEHYPISIFFPTNKIYNCKEDIKFEKPTWVTGPCNVMGYSYTDMVFEVAEDACYKILRKFKVVDWCDSDGDGIMNIWEHTQIIKVIDEDAPKIQQCIHREFYVGQDCKAEILLTNHAIDDQACGAQLLEWTVLVDLWADGTIDQEFSKLKNGDFYIAPVQNGVEVKIKLPQRVSIGNHKVFWSVRDDCGNIKTCHTTFTVVDNKPPTPYLYTLLTASFDATSMPLMVPARIFNVGSFDNCSPKHKLTYSFSEDVNDTIRIVDCTNAGFQFFTIYVTDMMGNFEVVDVFLLAFDNGSCNTTSNLQASLVEGNESVLSGAVIKATRNGMSVDASLMTGGQFQFENLPLYSDFMVEPLLPEIQNTNERINVQDLIWLQEYILGKRQLTQFEYIAADVDMDNSIRMKDLITLRKKILTGSQTFDHGQSYRVVFEPDNITPQNLAGLKNTGSIMEYDGKFDFRAVLIGDLTEANAVDTENRSDISIISTITDSGVDFYLPFDLDYRGIQIEIQLHHKDIEIESDQIFISPQTMYRDADKNIVRILISEEGQLKAGQPVFSLKGAVGNEYSLLAGSGVVYEDKPFTRLALTNRENEQTFHVMYPNPFSGNEINLGKDTKVTNVIFYTGQEIDFSQSGEVLTLPQTITPGILFVKSISKNGEIVVHKICKI